MATRTAAIIQKTINCLVRRRAHRSSRAPTNKHSDPTAALERLEWWSWCATIIILAGIALEAWEAIYFRLHGEGGSDVWAKVIADALVGIGLAIEAVCIFWAIVETRKEKAESDEKVAAANERASVADQKAAAAQLELAKLRAPRYIRPEQVMQIADAVRPFAGTPYDFTINSTDPGNTTVLWGLKGALGLANWTPLSWPGLGSGLCIRARR